MHKPVNLGRLYFQRQLNVQGYQCSADLRYVLFKHNVKPVSNERIKRFELVFNFKIVPFSSYMI